MDRVKIGIRALQNVWLRAMAQPTRTAEVHRSDHVQWPRGAQLVDGRLSKGTRISRHEEKSELC
jgi:hypothetical protein